MTQPGNYGLDTMRFLAACESEGSLRSTCCKDREIQTSYLIDAPVLARISYTDA